MLLVDTVYSLASSPPPRSARCRRSPLDYYSSWLIDVRTSRTPQENAQHQRLRQFETAHVGTRKTRFGVVGVPANHSLVCRSHSVGSWRLLKIFSPNPSSNRHARRLIPPTIEFTSRPTSALCVAFLIWVALSESVKRRCRDRIHRTE